MARTNKISSTSQPCAFWRCAAKATFNQPLCHNHWLEWEQLWLEECGRCHWFYGLGEGNEWAESDYSEKLPFHCSECFWHIVVEKGNDAPWLPWSGQPPELKPVLAHAELEPTFRDVYILKLSDGTFYIGQTVDLAIRLREHQDGEQAQTKGKEPKLVYFEQFVGRRDDVRQRENELTHLNQTGAGRRRLREMIEEFREPLRLLDLEA